MSTLPDRLKKARAKTGLTQEQVAKELGYKRATLANWETGRTEPDIETVTKLAAFYNVPVGWLLGGKANDLDPAITDLLKQVNDLTDEEKESLIEHWRFALDQAKKIRERRRTK